MKKKIKKMMSNTAVGKWSIAQKNKRLYERELKHKKAKEAEIQVAIDEKTPLVSIVVFAEKRTAFERLLASLQACTFYSKCEYIITFDNESEEMITYLDEQQACSFGLKQEITLCGVGRQHFVTAHAFHCGAQIAKGAYIVFVKDCVQVTDYWLDALYTCYNNHEKVGAVGARLFYPEISREHEMSKESYCVSHRGARFKRVQKKGRNYLQPAVLKNGIVDADIWENDDACLGVSGQVMFLAKEVYDACGGFDDQYHNGMEDFDLCLQLVKAGFHNYCTWSSMLLDYSFEKEKDKISDKHNMSLYRAKWTAFLLRAIGEEIDLRDISMCETAICNVEPIVLQDNVVDICGAMPEDDTKKFWGDYHYALALKEELEKRGYQANVLTREHWGDTSDAKTVIVLRGLRPYYRSVQEGQKVIMWNISHPADLSTDEYNRADFVFFASKTMQEKYADKLTVPTGVMMQCTDPAVMYCEEQACQEGEERFRYELLFVGNSRRVFRRILKDLLPTKHQLTVYGRHWEEYPVQEYVVDDYIDNKIVGKAYHDAKILLNDHWDDMREYGIISNRIFDALAAGAFVISDGFAELDETLKDMVVTYTDAEDLKEKIDYYLEHEKERLEIAQRGQKEVLEKHTFAHRAEQLIAAMNRL